MSLAVLAVSGAVMAVLAVYVYSYDHFSYVLPIGKFVEFEYGENVERSRGRFESANLIYRDFSRISDDAVRVVFDGEAKRPLGDVPEFYHEEDYAIGQTVLVDCEPAPGGGTYLDYYRLVGITQQNGTDYFDLVWGSGHIPDRIACRYPDVIPFTKDLNSPETVPPPR